jgi:hypothetical protein
MVSGIGIMHYVNFGSRLIAYGTVFYSSMPMAHLRQAPEGRRSGVEEEPGFSWLTILSQGTSWPSPSVTGIVPCLRVIMSKRRRILSYKFMDKYRSSNHNTYPVNIVGSRKD